MQRLVPKLLIAVLVAILSIGLLACGGASDDEGGSSGDDTGAAAAGSDFSPLNTAPDDSQTGGELTVIASGDVDNLDPGASYYQFSYMVQFAVTRSLMGWPPDAEEPVPDLADGEPEIGDDGKTVTFKIKPGVKYGPPVDREVVAADFKYALERALMPGVGNGYIGTYLNSLEGYEAATQAVEKNPTKAPEITGVTAPDDETLELRFTEPVALNAIQVLSLPLGSPVAEEYAAEHDAENPSQYSQHVVATGPYMVANDAQGKLTGYVPGESIELVRNPNWEAETDFRPAFLDTIKVQEGFTNTPGASQRILNGEGMVNGDFSPDPPVLEKVVQEQPEQLALAPQGGTRYVTLNTQLAPFDDINVRKAVLAAIDREAMRLATGGEPLGAIANHFIPPGMPGFEESGGYEGTGVDFLESPSGDLDLAAEYMREAGFESGQYEGDEEVLVIGENSTVERRVSEIVVDALEQLGFNVNNRAVSQEAVFTRFCTNPSAEVAICPNIAWAKDFNSPQTVLAPTFGGAAISEEFTTNISLLDVPEINTAMDEAVKMTDENDQADAWAEVNRMVTAQAPALPWLWNYFPAISSPDVVNVINKFNGQTDISYASVDSGG